MTTSIGSNFGNQTKLTDIIQQTQDKNLNAKDTLRTDNGGKELHTGVSWKGILGNIGRAVVTLGVWFGVHEHNEKAKATETVKNAINKEFGGGDATFAKRLLSNMKAEGQISSASYLKVGDLQKIKTEANKQIISDFSQKSSSAKSFAEVSNKEVNQIIKMAKDENLPSEIRDEAKKALNTHFKSMASIIDSHAQILSLQPKLDEGDVTGTLMKSVMEAIESDVLPSDTSDKLMTAIGSYFKMAKDNPEIANRAFQFVKTSNGEPVFNEQTGKPELMGKMEGKEVANLFSMTKTNGDLMIPKDVQQDLFLNMLKHEQTGKDSANGFLRANTATSSVIAGILRTWDGGQAFNLGKELFETVKNIKPDFTERDKILINEPGISGVEKNARTTEWKRLDAEARTEAVLNVMEDLDDQLMLGSSKMTELRGLLTEVQKVVDEINLNDNKGRTEDRKPVYDSEGNKIEDREPMPNPEKLRKGQVSGAEFAFNVLFLRGINPGLTEKAVGHSLEVATDRTATKEQKAEAKDAQKTATRTQVMFQTLVNGLKSEGNNPNNVRTHEAVESMSMVGFEILRDIVAPGINDNVERYVPPNN